MKIIWVMERTFRETFSVNPSLKHLRFENRTLINSYLHLFHTWRPCNKTQACGLILLWKSGWVRVGGDQVRTRASNVRPLCVSSFFFRLLPHELQVWLMLCALSWINYHLIKVAFRFFTERVPSLNCCPWRRSYHYCSKLKGSVPRAFCIFGIFFARFFLSVIYFIQILLF